MKRAAPEAPFGCNFVYHSSRFRNAYRPRPSALRMASLPISGFRCGETSMFRILPPMFQAQLLRLGTNLYRRIAAALDWLADVIERRKR